MVDRKEISWDIEKIMNCLKKAKEKGVPALSINQIANTIGINESYLRYHLIGKYYGYKGDRLGKEYERYFKIEKIKNPNQRIILALVSLK